MTEDTEISEEINKLKSDITKLEDIVSKANNIKVNKMTLLKEAKENKIIPKKEIKQLSNDIKNFDKIATDKTLIKKAKSRLIKLELEMAPSEYINLQNEYKHTYSEIENQINK
jgi:hypothetical protein